MIIAARVLLIWLLCLLCVFLHESGHALGHRIAGGKAGGRVIAGSGPEFFRTARCSFRLIPAGGYFIPEEEAGTRKEKILMLAGGPLVSLLLAALFVAVCFRLRRSIPAGSGLYEILFPVSAFLLYFNFFQFLFTVLPIRYRVICRGSESDGLQILRSLRAD